MHRQNLVNGESSARVLRTSDDQTESLTVGVRRSNLPDQS
jgi:hypothetical protein